MRSVTLPSSTGRPRRAPRPRTPPAADARRPRAPGHRGSPRACAKHSTLAASTPSMAFSRAAYVMFSRTVRCGKSTPTAHDGVDRPRRERHVVWPQPRLVGPVAAHAQVAHGDLHGGPNEPRQREQVPFERRRPGSPSEQAFHVGQRVRRKGPP